MSDTDRPETSPCCDDISGRRAKPKLSLRRVALLLHRYVGLAIAVFLIVSALTGSLLAFHHEIDAALNPELFEVRPQPPATSALSPLVLLDRARDIVPPGSKVTSVTLNTPPDQSVAFWIDLPKEVEDAGADNEYFFDPYTARLTGTRRWGDLRQGRKGLMPFVYSLHSALALGEVGEILLGIVALFWTVDCFVGAYLTFPVAGPRAAGSRRKGWFGRWRRSWVLKTTKTFSSVFTWHRASGLWVWGMLLVFAWSGVSLNLHEVYDPTMKVLAGPGQPYAVSTLETPLDDPALSFSQAHRFAREVMAKEAAARGFEIFEERSLRYRPASGVYEYRAYSSRDISQKYANTTVWIDGNTGERKEAWLPTGESGNDTFSTWIYQLHFGTITAGRGAYQLLVMFLGIAVCGLSGTGVWLWWKRRSTRSAIRVSTL